MNLYLEILVHLNIPHLLNFINLIHDNLVCYLLHHSTNELLCFLGDRRHASGEAIPPLGSSSTQVVEQWVESHYSVLVDDLRHDICGGIGNQYRLDQLGSSEP